MKTHYSGTQINESIKREDKENTDSLIWAVDQWHSKMGKEKRAEPRCLVYSTINYTNDGKKNATNPAASGIRTLTTPVEMKMNVTNPAGSGIRPIKGTATNYAGLGTRQIQHFPEV